MSVGREDIMTALFNLVEGVGDFKDTGRRVKMWSQVTAFPAMYLRNVSDQYQRQQILSKVTMRAEVWLYTHTTDADSAPGIELNNIMDALEAAFVPDNPQTNTLTLGGLVQHCWIEGEVMYDPGDLDGYGKAVVPVHILVP